MSLRKILLGALALSALAAWPSQAHAEEVVYAGPNRPLLWSGVVTAGIPYIASVAVAAESSRTGDQSLYIPFVGPWVDLAQRGGCPVSLPTCNAETFNKVLLVGDGILQGIGAITILSSFFVPERVFFRRRYANVNFEVAPLTLRSGSGLAVLGTF
jgi:hypothetical protein